MQEIIRAVLFDFGGVIADEGFHDGLLEIGRRNGLDPEAFFETVARIIQDCGYLTGKAAEPAFWDAVRRATGIREGDDELRGEILGRFVIRPGMLDLADRIRHGGTAVALLSDQTDWLEGIDQATGLYGHFDAVFNSFRTGKSKHDASVFTDVCSVLAVAPPEALFVDDNAGHVERARTRSLRAIRFTTEEDLYRSFEDILPLLAPARRNPGPSAAGIDKQGPRR